jgi:hypothetical protein
MTQYSDCISIGLRCKQHNLVRCLVCEPIPAVPAKPTVTAPAEPATIVLKPEPKTNIPHGGDQPARARKPRMRRAVPEPMTATVPVKNEAAATITAVALKDGLFGSIALQNAAVGYRVFPVDAGEKKPSVKRFPELATTDREQIKRWAVQFPNASCGILATPDGHLFIDEDSSREFRQGYEVYSGEAFPISRTTESRPNHRQSHWINTDYSRAKLRNIPQSKTKDSMFSLRFRNLYVLGEGSQHPSGSTYRVLVDSPAIPIPDKLVDYIRSLEIEEQPTLQSTTVQNVLSTADGTIPPRFDLTILKGGRNNGVSEYVWHLWQNVTTSPEQLLDLARGYNEEHCWPPLSDDEIKSIVNGKLDKPVTGSNALMLGGKPLSTSVCETVAPLAVATSRPINDVSLFEGLPTEIEMMPFEDDNEGQPLDYKLLLPVTDSTKTSWIEENVQTASQLSDEPVRWVIHELLLHGAVTVLCAEHGSMKSILSLLMAKSILTNTQFAEREPIGEKLRVVYVDAENPRAVVKFRLRGIGLIDADNREIPGFKIWGGWLADSNLAPAKVMNDPRLIEDATLNPNTFYIFDALSSFIQSADENDNPEMANYMRMARELARKSAGVLILHHTPKNGRAEWRGAMAIIDQSDHAIAMERAGTGRGSTRKRLPGNIVDMSEIRFRACSSWANRLEVFFDTSTPDGRTGPSGIHIRYTTIKSGLPINKDSNVRFGDGSEDAGGELPDFAPTDGEIVAKAAAFIKETWTRNGQPVTQTQLKQVCGLSSARVATRCFSGGRTDMWQCVAAGRSLLYYPPGVKVPTAKEQAAAKVAARRAAESERKKGVRKAVAA